MKITFFALSSIVSLSVKKSYSSYDVYSMKNCIINVGKIKITNEIVMTTIFSLNWVFKGQKSFLQKKNNVKYYYIKASLKIIIIEKNYLSLLLKLKL